MHPHMQATIAGMIIDSRIREAEIGRAVREARRARRQHTVGGVLRRAQRLVRPLRDPSPASGTFAPRR